MRRRLVKRFAKDDPAVESALETHDERARIKQQLVRERGMSNIAAEHVLDREGYPRPLGLHSLFFYPGSARLRDRYLYGLLGLVAIAVVILILVL